MLTPTHFNATLSTLSSEMKEFNELMKKSTDIFALDDSELGCTNVTNHSQNWYPWLSTDQTDAISNTHYLPR